MYSSFQVELANQYITIFSYCQPSKLRGFTCGDHLYFRGNYMSWLAGVFDKWGKAVAKYRGIEVSR
jgi:hypothetical protein